MGVSDGAKSSSGDVGAISELETELALLREENAQLKVERHRPADVGHVIERMRSLQLQVSGEPSGAPAAPSATTQTIAEHLAMREGLMEACQEVQQAMQGIRGKLGALVVGSHGPADDRSKSERPAQPTVETAELESTEVAAASSELAQSVA